MSKRNDFPAKYWKTLWIIISVLDRAHTEYCILITKRRNTKKVKFFQLLNYWRWIIVKPKSLWNLVNSPTWFPAHTPKSIKSVYRSFYRIINRFTLILTIEYYSGNTRITYYYYLITVLFRPRRRQSNTFKINLGRARWYRAAA